MISMEKTMEQACFEVNEHGRLLSGNRRFCRMFGFEESEIPWHYVTDLCRFVDDWHAYRENINQVSFSIRMKNRKGRSFKCNLVREESQNPDGEIVFLNVVSKVGENKESVTLAAPVQSMVFIAKCAHCGEQIRVNTAAETRIRILCNKCAAESYPEAYHLKKASV